MKLHQLLQADDQAKSPNALLGVFGDQYLLAHNKMYQNVRMQVQGMGYHFSDMIDSKDLASIIFPLGQLDNILSQKTIPFVDNKSVIKQLVQSSIYDLDYDHILDGIKRNYIFHESCHGIARQASIDSKLPNQADSEKILFMLLEESFANACELLSVADVDNQTHKIFFEMNFYICMFEDKTNLKNAANDFGPSDFFRFIWMCYLHSNFLNDGFSEQEFISVTQICFPHRKLSPQDGRRLKSLAKNAFVLNPRFRRVTTDLHFRIHGIGTNLEKALSFDYLKMIKAERYQNYISALSNFLFKN